MEGDLLAGLACRGPVGELEHVAGVDHALVAVTHKILEQDLQRDRQRVDGQTGTVSQGSESVVAVLAVAGPQGTHRVR